MKTLLCNLRRGGVVAILLLTSLTSCQWSKIQVESSAYVTEQIFHGDISDILAAVEGEMRKHGYKMSPEGEPQEPAFLPEHPGSLGNRTLTFLHGGQDRIRIIAKPSGEGWQLYAMPEPDGYDTSFNTALCRRILAKVRSQFQTTNS